MMRKNVSQCSIGLMFALAAVVFLSGCVAGDVKVDFERRASVRKIAVHPIEPPPFVDPTHVYDNNAYNVLQVIRLLLGGGVSERMLDTQLWESRVEDLESGRFWHPTYVVTRQVETHLKGRNLYDVQILIPETKLYVGDKRRLSDPYAPIRDWYNGDRAAKGALAADSDVVVEAGISNYEVMEGYLLLQVHLRVVDPVNGEVLGRARANATPQITSMESLFANEAQEFNALFTETTERLTEQALRQLGL